MGLFFVILTLAVHSVFTLDVSWQIEDKMKIPSPVSSQLICHINDGIYFMGGRTVSNHTFSIRDTIYVFNSTNHSFHAIPTTLPTGAYFASNYICSNTSIYIFGPGTKKDSASGQLWIFNIDTHSFTNISFPSHVDQVSLPCAAVNTQSQTIFIVGGITSQHTISHQVLQFNLSTNRFINTTYFPVPRTVYGSMCHVIHNANINGSADSNDTILLVLGGESNTAASANIFVYNISHGRWIKLGKEGSLSEPRSFTKSVYDKDRNFVLVIGGGSASDEAFLDTSDVFYISNYSVLPAFGDKLPNRVQFDTVSQHKEQVFVWGGYGIVHQNKSNATNTTKANVNKIFVFNIAEDEKDTTWTSIYLIAGSCCFFFCCGCSAYLVCVKSQKKHKFGDDLDDPINLSYN